MEKANDGEDERFQDKDLQDAERRVFRPCVEAEFGMDALRDLREAPVATAATLPNWCETGTISAKCGDFSPYHRYTPRA